jgi:hypothetical protein
VSYGYQEKVMVGEVVGLEGGCESS